MAALSASPSSTGGTAPGSPGVDKKSAVVTSEVSGGEGAAAARAGTEGEEEIEMLELDASIAASTATEEDGMASLAAGAEMRKRK